MKKIEELLRKKYHLSSYQLAQLTFLGKMFFSETSKVIIMAIIFQKHLSFYFFTLSIMIILRCSTGGLHFYTYLGCLLTSTIYIWLAIILLPQIFVPLNLKLLLMLICIIICYYIGPVPSKYRPPFKDTFIKKCKKTISRFIFFYSLILYIIPESPYLIIGFWIIILHCFQLMTAKYTRKE